MSKTPHRIQRFITGKTIKDPNACIGYCWFKEHRGYLDPSLMLEHNCMGKGCHHFEKFQDHTYWNRIEKKKKQRAEGKAKKKQIESQKDQILQAYRDLITDVDGFAVCNIEKVGNAYVIRCVLTKRNVYPIIYTERIEKRFGVKIKLQYIQNTIQVRQKILAQYKTIPPKEVKTSYAVPNLIPNQSTA